MKGTLRRVTKLPFQIIANPVVGKEYHIRAERYQDSNGKYKTRYTTVRTTAPLYKQPGILHHITAQSRRFEGDFKRLSITEKINRIEPATLKGNIALNTVKGLNSTRKFISSNAMKTALMAETATVTIGGYGFRKIRQKVSNEFDSVDTGKIVSKTASVIGSAYNLKRTLYTHNVKKAYFQQKKQILLTEKSRKKALKSDYKSSLTNTKLKLRKQQSKLREIHKVYKSSYSLSPLKYQQRKKVKYNLNKPVRELQLKQKLYKNQKKMIRYTRREKLHYLTVPLSVKGATAVVCKPTSFIVSKSSEYAQDNDFIQALNSTRNAIGAVKRTARQINMQHYMHIEKKYNRKRRRINAKENKLRLKESKLLTEKNKQRRKKKKKKKQKSSFKQKVKNTVTALEKLFVDFFKFICKFFATIFLPLIVIVIILLILFTLLDGTLENNTYVLGTFNCNDYTIAQCINRYTKIAKEYNDKLIKCQSSDSWIRGLKDFGVNTSDYDDTPDDFIFGKSYYFNYDPVYDFDAYKFISFMCAYNYDFSKDNDDIENWEYDDSNDDIIEDLFYAEYRFEHKYINQSVWRSLNSLKPYPSSTEFLAVDSTGKTTVDGTRYGFVKFGDSFSNVPSVLGDYTTDHSIHFDLETGEIKNKADDYKKTGYYIQNVDLLYTLNNSTLNPFYTRYYDEDSKSSFMGFVHNGKLYHKTQLVVDGINFNYAVAKEDVEILTNNNKDFKDKQLVRFYQAEEYIKECKLYTNIKRKRTFDEAIKYLLKEKGNYKERMEFYNILADTQNKDAYGYGNHQMIKSPINNKTFDDLIEQNSIYNNFGYDMQNWNKTHCSINQHDGMDIVASKGTKVKAMISGEVDEIDTDSHTITLVTIDDMDYWYDGHYKTDTRIRYVNISPSVKEGDKVKVGDVIGTVDTYKHCYDDVDNPNANKNYLHITVDIYYGWWTDWQTVDPRFLIYRD